MSGFQIPDLGYLPDEEGRNQWRIRARTPAYTDRRREARALAERTRESHIFLFAIDEAINSSTVDRNRA